MVMNRPGRRVAGFATLLLALAFLTTFRVAPPVPAQVEEPVALPGRYHFDPETGAIRASVTAADGSVTRLTAGRGGPIVFPPGFTLLPGAELIEHVAVLTDGGSRVLLTMTSARPVAEIAAYYRAEAKAAGIAIDVAIATDDAATLAGEGFSLHVRRTGGASRAQLSVATPGLVRIRGGR